MRINLHLRTIFLALILACGSAFVPACVYEVDVQQGNKLEPKDVENVKVGMTRNQIRFLLGTPVVADVFRDDRWYYIYYFRAGKSRKPERRWLIVWFDGEIVSEIQRDVETKPG
jgi:outer membrane protein assembly factor BamE